MANLLSIHIPTDISKSIQKVLHIYFALEFKETMLDIQAVSYAVSKTSRSFYENSEHALA